MNKVVLVTGASSGFGRLMANALAAGGHTVYASMRGLSAGNAAQASEIAAYAESRKLDLRTIELNVQSEESATSAVASIIAAQGRLDVLIHNAGHMVFGASEAYTADELARLYDVNVLGTQRVNRAVLPHMRRAGSGLVIWISSSSVAGGIPPMLGPYFAAKAGMDALAVCYARELAPFGIETSIVVPGAFTKGTNHFAHAGEPSDNGRAAEYEAALPPHFAATLLSALSASVPDDADPESVAAAVVRIVESPFGKRPFRIVVDPADDGSAVAFPVIDRVRAEFLHRIGFADLLRPADPTGRPALNSR